MREAVSIAFVGSRPAEDGAVLEALACRAALGERDAFSEIYTLLADDLYRYVRGQIRDYALAEDVVAEVFLRAWRFLPKYRQGSNTFRPWVFAIARNQVRDAWKREQQQPGPLDEDLPEAVPETDHQAETLRLVHHALRSLNSDQRDVVLLRFVGEKSHAEIGRLVGKREGAVRATLLRALRRMRKEMADVAA